jgi:hypothetical protein
MDERIITLPIEGEIDPKQDTLIKMQNVTNQLKR